MAGLRVNSEMQVLTPDAKAIPGLYAGFFTAGGIGGENCFNGALGNCTIHAGAAISGVGGFMAINGLIDNE